MLERKTWHVNHLDIVDEPMAKSLLTYRHYEDRQPTDVDANVVSSNLPNGKHAPIVDLDFPHQYVPSTTPGHGHLYLDVEISGWRWFMLNLGLYLGGVIEKGYFVWSLRRRGNYVRRPGVQKTTAEEKVTYSYGMFFRLRDKK